MMFKNRKSLFTAVTLIGLVGIAFRSSALPDINVTGTQHRAQLKTTAGCVPATANIDLDINNVRARLMTGGDMWWNQGTQVAAYEIPKGSGKNSQFAASCWIGGYDAQNQLKVAAQTYRQTGNDFWPGILDGNTNDITATECANWDYFWKVNKSDILQFISLSKGGQSTSSSQFDVINHWPAAGNTMGAKGNNNVLLSLVAGRTYAPFVDLNNNGIYEPNLGEYPDILGDQFIWWVFNDKGNAKTETQTPAIGLEVQTSAFAFSSQDFLNNATFCKYHVINRGPLRMDSAYIAVWDDCDLGWAFDDYIGCDTTRGLGIDYNGTNPDGSGQVNSYGTLIPQVGLDFFQGPSKIFHTPNGDSSGLLGMSNFTYYNNDFSSIGNPVNGIQVYGYMTGTIRSGQRFTDDFHGYGVQSKGYGSGPTTHFVFPGDPGNHNEWSECSSQNPPGDRRMIFSAGPFVLEPGAANDIIFGCVWTPNVGGCPNTSFRNLQAVDDQAQDLFDNHFKTIEGPNAPVLTCRELDKHLVFYITNPYGSNNYKEQYGTNDSALYHQASTKAYKLGKSDSVYKFQGYRVFQLADGSITSSQIYNSDGTIDNTKAVEVFQCDIHDGVSKIINWYKDPSINDSAWSWQTKVNGKDSGIVHSFQITQDQFAATSDKSLVNYKTYYFVAVAYAWLDWGYNMGSNAPGFTPSGADTTQNIPYLESTHGPSSSAIPIIACMPNPANGAMGTTLNSDYGTGVTIQRIVGNGNGGNDVLLSTASEDSAVANNIVKNPVYASGRGPIEVKVIDPVKVPAMDWTLMFDPGHISYANPDQGDSGAVTTWKLMGVDNANPTNNVTIMSETSIGTFNEQILAAYGLSVSIGQTLRPGDDQVNGNGLITSDIAFMDTTKPWLAGVQDGADSNALNWLRSGNNTAVSKGNNPCNFNDATYSNGIKVDSNAAYANLIPNFSLAKSTWGPFALTAPFANNHKGVGSECGFALMPTIGAQPSLFDLQSVDIVFTQDRSKWTRCVVVETQEDSSLSEGHALKFGVRAHPSWLATGELDANGNPKFESNPVYNTNGTPNLQDPTWGMSFFPGYAINPETGERLNIVFGEDSWLNFANGNDMLWNPNSTILSSITGGDVEVIFGGKHFVYVLNSRYDADSMFKSKITSTSVIAQNQGWKTAMWAGIPLLNSIGNIHYLPISQGFVPTDARVRFRITRPYSFFNPDRAGSYVSRTTPLNPANFPTLPSSDTATTLNHGFPVYKFSTANLAKTGVTDATNKSALLDRIMAVPNPYYAHSGIEANRFDTKVRIINLPAQATIDIYALDGTLIRTLSKSDSGTPYIDWDIRNSVGLPVSSGMYLMHVKAVGIGETVIKWFGGVRPIDITSY